MAKKTMSLEVDGVAELQKSLENLTNNGVLYPLVYKGTEVVADEMRRQLNALQTSKGYGTSQHKRYVNDYDKKILLAQMGVAPIKERETINSKVGFDGYYMSKAGERRPVPLLANSVNAGTSFMEKQAFIDATARATRNKVFQAMKEQADKIIKV